MRELVDKLVDERLAEADIERHELQKEARWLGVRVLTLEQTLKKSRDENKALAEYLQLCFDEIRSQDDRLSPRLATMESEVLALASRSSRGDVENIELRRELSEALAKIDALSVELFELIYDAKSVAVQARGSADAVAVQADEMVVDIREAHQQVLLLEDRTSSISSELEETVEAAEYLVSGLSDAAEVSALAHAVAEQARLSAEGMSEELRADLDRRTEALREEIDRKAAGRIELSGDAAERLLEGELKDVIELAEEVRVLAEKAKSRADYAADSTDELRADFDEHADDLRDLEERSATLRSDLDKRTNALRNDLSKRTGKLRADLDKRTEELRSEIEELPEAKRSPEDLQVLRSEVAMSLDALRARLDDRLNGYTAADPATGRSKRWHAHLRVDSAPEAEDVPALPSET